MSYYPAERDLSAFKCRDQDGSARQCSTMEPADDSVIAYRASHRAVVWQIGGRLPPREAR